MKRNIAIVSALLFAVLLTTPVLAETGKKLNPSSLRSCTAIENDAKGRMQSLIDLAANMEMDFESIAMKTEDFYTIKIVPTGKTLGNYDSLLTDISAKRGVLAMDLSSARNVVTEFSCSGDDPRGLLLSFRLAMQRVKNDLKNYRTSVRNLIVAVRTLGSGGTPGPTTP